MNQIIRIICCIIFIPLVLSLVQATLASASDCVHCQKLQVSKPDCCAVMTSDTMERDGAQGAGHDEACPHAGFCQGGVGPAANLLPYLSQFEITAPVSHVTVTFKSSQPDSSWYDASPFPPLKLPLRLFTLNCSFLI